MLVSFGRRSADDERRPSFVDQHRVHLVDDGEVMLALHQLLWTHGHVVAEVVKPKLVVRPKRHVAFVRLTSRLAVGLVLVDAVDGESVEFIERAHPLGVATGEVVVHRHHVHPASCQGIEEHRQRRHQRLSFPGLHLRDFAAMQSHPTDQLHVVVHHVPRHGGSRRRPRLLPERLVALNRDEVAIGRNLTVHVRRRDLHRTVGSKAARRLLDQGKRLRHDVGEDFLEDARSPRAPMRRPARTTPLSHPIW